MDLHDGGERQNHPRLLARDDVLSEIDTLIGGGATSVLVTGVPGVGKSAILASYVQRVASISDVDRVRGKIAGASRHLARWAEAVERKVRTKERWAVAYHFLRTSALDNPETVVRSLIKQIEDRFIDARDKDARDDHPLDRRLGELLVRVSSRVLEPESMRLLLVIDDLDEAEDEHGFAELARILPFPLPPRVVLLASSRPTVDLSVMTRYSPARIDLDSPRWSASNHAACRAFWDGVARELQLPGDVAEKAVQRAQGNMLYSAELAEWLKRLPPERRASEPFPRTLGDVFAKLWRQVTHLPSEQEALVRRSLAILCASPSPLPLSAIAAHAGWSDRLDATTFLGVARPFLQCFSATGAEDVFYPFHDELRTLISEQLAGEAAAPVPALLHPEAAPAAPHRDAPAPAASSGGAATPAAQATAGGLSVQEQLLAAIAAAKEKAVGPVAERYAFLVGVRRYDDRNIGNLRFCVDDVVALRAALEKLGYRHVLSMHDDVEDESLLPMRNRVKNELIRLSRGLKPNDMLLVHFSCHGTLLDGKPVLLFRDTGQEALAESSLAVEDVKKILLESPARRKILFLDACHAGVELGRDVGGQALSPAFVHNVFELAEGLAVLSGSTSQQRALERPEAKLGVFTSFVIEGLLGKADRSSPPKGFVTVDDLNYYVTDGVQHWSRQQRMSLQLPTARVEGTGSMILADFRDQKA
ncbi:caspase family protein [Sorangium sp. So ce136]|uniref:caspase family protein n=1 Tax=Sorangium sp. So ce136 TaxID=3133284 RepID=UPI003EFE2DAB